MINSARKKIITGILLSIGLSSFGLQAQPFTECPTEAFLVQDKLANLYGVQLATGFYQKSSPVDWNQQKMNALALAYMTAIYTRSVITTVLSYALVLIIRLIQLRFLVYPT